MKKNKLFIIVFIGLISLNSCETIKPFQMISINDPDMELVDRKSKKFHNSFQVYREGASGANGGKSGGGCGCN